MGLISQRDLLDLRLGWGAPQTVCVEVSVARDSDTGKVGTRWRETRQSDKAPASETAWTRGCLRCLPKVTRRLR